MNTVPFDFDKWMKLYQEDPEAFERERQNAISTFLDSVPEERREGLQRLQWRIDAERRRHRSAIGSMVAIHRMMLAEFSRLSISLEVLQALLRGGSASSFLAEKRHGYCTSFPKKAPLRSILQETACWQMPMQAVLFLSRERFLSVLVRACRSCGHSQEERFYQYRQKIQWENHRRARRMFYIEAVPLLLFELFLVLPVASEIR